MNNEGSIVVYSTSWLRSGIFSSLWKGPGVVNTMSTFHWGDYTVFVLVLMLSTGTGIFFAWRGRKENSKENYLMANRGMKIIPVSISLFIRYGKDSSGLWAIIRPLYLSHWGCDKLLLVCKRHLDAFSSIKLWNSTKISIKCDPVSQLIWTSIAWDNGLTSNRRQSIIWTNDVLYIDAYMRHSASII